MREIDQRLTEQATLIAQATNPQLFFDTRDVTMMDEQRFVTIEIYKMEMQELLDYKGSVWDFKDSDYG